MDLLCFNYFDTKPESVSHSNIGSQKEGNGPKRNN